ncbi:MAG: cupin domain-containing protein [Candidatus Brocadiae bacterium]|nr:cupin domain-containing protein [Candidatus Brocadiia bacterium]
MADTGGKGRERYIVADFSNIEGVPCPCGTARRALASESNPTCTLHMTEISRDAETHYHKRLTEVYYFLEGEGQIELDGKRCAVRPGMAVLIPPGTRHRAIVGARPMKILNFVTPPFDPDDEWFD